MLIKFLWLFPRLVERPMDFSWIPQCNKWELHKNIPCLYSIPRTMTQEQLKAQQYTEMASGENHGHIIWETSKAIVTTKEYVHIKQLEVNGIVQKEYQK